MNPATSARVMISYARADGEALARALRERLTASGIDVWQDRAHLEGGHDWWLQIRAALDHVRFLVWLMTPAALSSDVVRREWRYARSQGVAVYPVAASQSLDFQALPRWMRDLHFYDLAHEWDKFVDDLRREPLRRRVPFMVDALPGAFVRRPAAHADLLAFLVDATSGDPKPGVVALLGAGGFGKTTLAQAVCHDERIQQAFDDGIVWVRFGEQPGDLTGRLQDLVEIISGTRPDFTGLDAATTRFREVLADRDILLVLDDVWNADHVRPFLSGGARCARLMTTRNAATLPAGATLVDTTAMTPQEAQQLLLVGLDAAATVDAQSLARLLQLLGGWPLLVNLVNGVLRQRHVVQRQPVNAALAHALAALGKRGVTAFDARRAEARDQAVEHTLEVSLDLLDATERARYFELGVFAGGATPMAAVERLWGARAGLDPMDVEDQVSRLASLSLLQADFEQRSVQLHDVLRDYLIRRSDVPAPVLHQALVDAYATDAPGGWPTGPDDGYCFQHIGRHLAAAGRADELFRLLTADPAWMLAQYDATRGDSAYRGDLALCIESLDAGDAAEHLHRAVLLHTARQVVSHRVRRYTDEDLQVLVCLGRRAEALNCVHLRDTPGKVALGLIAVATAHGDAGQVDSPLLTQAEALARAVVDDATRADVWAALAHARASARAYDAALSAARQIPMPDARASSLGRLAGFPPASAQMAVQEIDALMDVPDLAMTPLAREELAVRLASGGWLDTALKVHTRLAPPIQARLLPTLLTLFAATGPDASFDAALAACIEAAMSLPHAEERADALCGVGAALLDLGRGAPLAEVMQRARVAAREIATADYFEALGAVASVAAIAVPQDPFFVEAARALDRVGLILRAGGCGTDADAVFAEAREFAAQGPGDARWESTLASIGREPADEHPSPAPDCVPPSPLDLARQGRLTDAADRLDAAVALREQNAVARDTVAIGLAAACARRGEARRAQAVVECIAEAHARWRAQLACLIADHPQADPAQAARATDRLFAAAAAHAPLDRSILLSEAVAAFAGAGMNAQAVRCADEIVACGENAYPGLRLTELVTRCLAAGHPDVATALAARVTDPLWTRSARQALEHHLHRQTSGDVEPDRDGAGVVAAVQCALRGNLEQAIAQLDAIEFDGDRARAAAQIVDCMGAPEHAQAADRLLSRAEGWLPPFDAFLDTDRRIERMAALAMAAGRAGLQDATLRLAAGLRRHEDVESADKWTPASQILAGDHRQRAERARAARIAALTALVVTLLCANVRADLVAVEAAFEHPSEAAAARRLAASRVAGRGHGLQALDAIGPQGLDEWIDALGALRGLERATLAEALRIVSWIRPDWAQIAGVLRAEH